MAATAFCNRGGSALLKKEYTRSYHSYFAEWVLFKTSFKSLESPAPLRFRSEADLRQFTETINKGVRCDCDQRCDCARTILAVFEGEEGSDNHTAWQHVVFIRALPTGGRRRLYPRRPDKWPIHPIRPRNWPRPGTTRRNNPATTPPLPVDPNHLKKARAHFIFRHRHSNNQRPNPKIQALERSCTRYSGVLFPPRPDFMYTVGKPNPDTTPWWDSARYPRPREKQAIVRHEVTPATYEGETYTLKELIPNIAAPKKGGTLRYLPSLLLNEAMKRNVDWHQRRERRWREEDERREAGRALAERLRRRQGGGGGRGGE